MLQFKKMKRIQFATLVEYIYVLISNIYIIQIHSVIKHYTLKSYYQYS